MQCEYVFELQPSMYSTATARIAYIANLTTEQARRCVMASREGSAPYMQDYAAFINELKFLIMMSMGRIQIQLCPPSSRVVSVAEYATEFRILAECCQWNEPALFSAFCQGLAESVKDALAGRERPATLNQLISLSISLDECHRECKRERAHQSRATTRPPPPSPVSLHRPVQDLWVLST